MPETSDVPVSKEHHHISSQDFAQIVGQLRETGYAVGWRSLDARRCVPQKRLRVYIAPRLVAEQFSVCFHSL